MRCHRFRQFIAYLICVGLIYTPFLQAAQLSLPTGDLIAPEVSHEVIEETLEAGSSVQIKAKVTDNVGVKSVTLFYRTKGVEEYERVILMRIANTDEYTVTLGKEVLVEPGIEYYIQAVDLAGNTLLHGYSFSPLSVAVAKPRAPMKPESAVTTKEAMPEAIDETAGVEPDSAKEKKSKTWLWIALGALAVGAIAAAASGGSSDGGDNGGGGGDTGTVVITMPTP